ncbi:hypothetical protein AU194_04760 [Mycobacterium sp. GA-2829]|nr:hypothetical protein AU194_04760 [Mycobacterium sp. GA-2829]
MVTQSLPLDDPHAPMRIGAAATRLEYRLDVVGADTADLVRSAGGWLFDRAMAGWRVDAWLLDAEDLRPLQVLGVRGHHLGSAAGRSADERAAGLAVSAQALGAVGDVVRDALATGDTEIVLWGGRWPAQWGGRTEEVRYRLSAAARTFKRHALDAACCDMQVDAVESLMCGGYRPVDSDLVVAGR